MEERLKGILNPPPTRIEIDEDTVAISDLFNALLAFQQSVQPLANTKVTQRMLEPMLYDIDRLQKLTSMMRERIRLTYRGFNKNPDGRRSTAKKTLYTNVGGG